MTDSYSINSDDEFQKLREDLLSASDAVKDQLVAGYQKKVDALIGYIDKLQSDAVRLQSEVDNAKNRLTVERARYEDAEEARKQAEEDLQTLKKLNIDEAAPAIEILFKTPKEELQTSIETTTESLRKRIVRNSMLANVVSIITIIVTAYFAFWTSDKTSVDTRVGQDQLERRFRETLNNSLDAVDSRARDRQTGLESRLRSKIDSSSSLVSTSVGMAEERLSGQVSSLKSRIDGTLAQTNIIRTSIGDIQSTFCQVEALVSEIEKWKHDHGIRNRNDIRLMYKLYLADEYSGAYECFSTAMRAAGVDNSLIPTSLNDYRVWDQQFLHIVEGISRRAAPLERSGITRTDSRWTYRDFKQQDDATEYYSWGIDPTQMTKIRDFVTQRSSIIRTRLAKNGY